MYIYALTVLNEYKSFQLVNYFLDLIHMFVHVQCTRMYYTLNTCTLNKCDLTVKFRQVHLNIYNTYLYLQYM